MFEPSEYQKEIFKKIKEGKRNLLVNAVAGSGKTTTIVNSTKYIPENKRCIFVAFNKSIANELETRLSKHIEAKTLHSVGLSSFFYNNYRPKIEVKKTWNIISAILEREEENETITSIEVNGLRFNLNKLVSLVKANLANHYSDEVLLTIMERHEIHIDIPIGQVINWVDEILMEGLDQAHKVIDFDDMLYVPIMENFNLTKYDVIFVDEVQDLNKNQFEFIKRMCHSGTRIYAVGDENQSIYAFRGADIFSVPKFRQYFNTVDLPLTICYRCPKKVVKLAQKYVPELEFYEKNGKGEIVEWTIIEVQDNIKPKDMILCRVNKDLLECAFVLRSKGHKVCIRGHDIAKQLLYILDKFKNKTPNEITQDLGRIRDHFQRELRGLREEQNHRRHMIISLIDMYESLMVFTSRCETTRMVRREINDFFGQKKDAVILSTVHRAKGLEADNVYILNKHLMPHPRARGQLDMAQESNLIYVAFTRAKKRLIFFEYETK